MALHRVHQQILRSHHLFEPLNEEQMEELMSSSHLLNVDKGSPLFRQGEPVTSFYFVISDAVKAYPLTADSQEKPLISSARQTVAVLWISDIQLALAPRTPPCARRFGFPDRLSRPFAG